MVHEAPALAERGDTAAVAATVPVPELGVDTTPWSDQEPELDGKRRLPQEDAAVEEDGPIADSSESQSTEMSDSGP
jgi:hypothetical protein